MSEAAALAGFTDKWRARWPEWRVAEVFVPAAQRDVALGWLALRQELTDAAWGGADPRPGEAKLAWWAEELQGWSQGRRRHPLGIVLQPRPAPWTSLAAGLPALLASREAAADAGQAIAVLQPFAEGIGSIAAALFASATPAPPRSVVLGLLAEQLLQRGHEAAPLQLRARHGEAALPDAIARAWAAELLQAWPRPHGGAAAGRIHAALLRARLQGFAAGPVASAPLPPWRALWPAWRAARG